MIIPILEWILSLWNSAGVQTFRKASDPPESDLGLHFQPCLPNTVLWPQSSSVRLSCSRFLSRSTCLHTITGSTLVSSEWFLSLVCLLNQTLLPWPSSQPYSFATPLFIPPLSWMPLSFCVVKAKEHIIAIITCSPTLADNNVNCDFLRVWTWDQIVFALVHSSYPSPDSVVPLINDDPNTNPSRGRSTPSPKY